MTDVSFHSLLGAPVARKPVVMKFGGTSVADPARIRAVAARALAAQALGSRPVLVVSAMAGETDRLLSLAREMGREPDPAEVDALAATGEQATAALMALAIQAQGGKARSFLGHQLALRTAGPHGEARVRSLDPRPLRAALRRGEIPVIAGFQGVTQEGRVTTLGRGGSDTTAVAIAAALDAAVCEIYTDVDGVHGADPRIVAGAKQLPVLGYAPMLALAENGAKVLHPRSVALAQAHGVPIRVRSSFTRGGGTLVTGHCEIEDAKPVAAVSSDTNVTLVTISPSPSGAGASGPNADGTAVPGAMVMAVRRADLSRTITALSASKWQVEVDDDVAAVSLVGGAAVDPAAAADVATALKAQNIAIKGLSITEQTITCLVPRAAAALAVRALHDAFVAEQL